MARPTGRVLILLLFAAPFAAVASGQAQGPARDPLGAARDLYASARYDEALEVLNDMRPAAAATSPSERRSIEQYRSLCLLALGRGSEAQSAIAAVVNADPSYLPSESEASPRVRAAFSDVRKRLLPDIASSRYSEAKATFDRKDFRAAAEQFRRVIALLEDPDMGGRLSDLRTLAAGFLDLSAAAATPPPPPLRPEPVVPVTPPTPKPDLLRIYTASDANVAAPVAIRQEVPRLPASSMMQAREHGVLEIVIDEQGRVISLAVRVSIHPLYDQMLLAAARDWRYRPATLAGAPVKYRKMIQVNVTRRD